MFRSTTLFFLFFLAIPFKAVTQYKVMFSDNYPPFNYTDNKGELVGFNVDILKAIIKLYKAEIEIDGKNWDVVNSALKHGEIDAIGGTHYPGSIDNNHIYCRSTINTSHCFLYNTAHVKRFSLETLRTAKKPMVALWRNDVLSRYILSINPSTKFIYVQNYEELIEQLERKEVTCVIAQRIGAMYYAHQLNKNNIRTSDHRILERNMGFKVSKENPELAQMLNNGLEVLLANGEYQKIYDKWIQNYNDAQNEWKQYLKYILFASIVILILILLLLFANQVLQKRVRKKTQDLRQQLDVNAKIMSELELEKQRAQESDKMKSAFLANMSHEIRTPMNGILGFTDLLETQSYSEEEQLQFISVIKQSGNRMLSTINNIIDVSKLESGAEKIKIEEVNIEQLLSELIVFFNNEAKSNGLELIGDIKSSTTNKSFYTDEYKLNSILTNLIKNALKFTQKGHIRIDCTISDERAEFVVEDTGIGIPEDKQKAIFNQFVQADSSHSSGFEGSGLGLSITKGYTEIIKGEISMKSELEKGTTFLVSIPNLKQDVLLEQE